MNILKNIFSFSFVFLTLAFLTTTKVHADLISPTEQIVFSFVPYAIYGVMFGVFALICFLIIKGLRRKKDSDSK